MSPQSEQPPVLKAQPRAKTLRILLIWAAVLGGIFVLMLFKDRMEVPADTISQYRFEQLVDSNLITHATIKYSPTTAALNEIVGGYNKAESGRAVVVPFRAVVRLTPDLENKLLSLPQFEPYESNPVFTSILFSVLPIIVIAVLIWFFFIRQIRKAAKPSGGQSDAHIRTMQQQDRLDKILSKWEEQAARMDTVLEKMERENGLKH